MAQTANSSPGTVPMPPVVVLLNKLARRSARIVTATPRTPGEEAMLAVDRNMCELVYMVRRLEEHIPSLPDEHFVRDLLDRLDSLQIRTITAFFRPLYSEERARWVDELDALSTECYRMALAMQHAEEELRKEREQISAKKKMAKKLRKAADGGLASQLGVVKEQMEESGAWEAELDEDEQEAQALRRRELSRASWYDKESSKLAEAARFDVGYLDPEEDAGIIQYPVILTFFDFEREGKDKLSEAGIRTATVYGAYQQIHNCRLLGIKASNAPANPTHRRRYAQSMLQDLQAHPDWGEFCREFFLTGSKPTHAGGHLYYILLPLSCRGYVSIEEWGWGKDVSAGFVSEVHVKNGKKTTRKTNIPRDRMKRPVRPKTLCGRTGVASGEKAAIEKGPYSGLIGEIKRDGPDPSGKVKVSLQIFGRHTNALVSISDIRINQG